MYFKLTWHIYSFYGFVVLSYSRELWKTYIFKHNSLLKFAEQAEIFEIPISLHPTVISAGPTQ